MSLITVSNLTKSFGHRDIFSGLTFGVAKGERLAIVGANGVGKTTLLRILVGEDEASSGSFHRARGIRIGYLPQEADFDTQGTLWDECLSVFAPLLEQQAELHRLETLMSDPAHAEEALARYGALQHDFERKGGYTYNTRIKQVLTGLGFAEGDYAASLDHLSGGSAPAPTSPGCCSPTPTCCCSTNRPTTSTSPRWSGSKVTSTSGKARRSSSRTTAISSTRLPTSSSR